MSGQRVIAVVFLLLAGLAGYLGWQQWGPLPASVAARVNGDAIPIATLDVFVAAAQRSDPQTDREAVLRGLVENRLLAGLQAGHSHGEEAGRVGYDRATRAEQQRFRLIRTAFADELRAAVEASGVTDSLDHLTAPLAMQPDALAPMLKLDQALYTRMTDDQREAARHYVLARYRFAEDQPEQVLTLWELYRRQNIQLKVQMHNLNLAFVREAVNQYLTMKYVFYWFEQHSGLSGDEVAAVDRCIDDALKREALLHGMGLMHDIHDDNPQLRERAADVSDEQIAAYYASHRDAFTRVERVRARHLRVDNQQAADRIVAEIRSGLSFDDAVARYSMAPDRDTGGKLGWIDRDSRQDHWTRSLAFVQPQGKVSPPFRSPQGDKAPYWEILWVDERVMGYQPVDSESVRYRAARAVAREQMQQDFRAMLAEVTDEASLRLNHEVL